MYIFEAIYNNMETEETATKSIEVEAASNYQDAFQNALIMAFTLQGTNEELYEIRNIAC